MDNWLQLKFNTLKTLPYLRRFHVIPVREDGNDVHSFKYDVINFGFLTEEIIGIKN